MKGVLSRARHAGHRRRAFYFVRALFTLAALWPSLAAADDIKIGILKVSGSGLVFIAQEKGYFKAEGLNAQLVFFESAQPISVATASGDVDVGVTGLTGGLYSLGGQGALRIIGGGAREVPGFNYQTYLVSNRAYDAGARGYKDFPGHTFGLSQIGSPPHYSLALIGEKYGFDLKNMRIMPLQSIANIMSAIIGGQVDFTLLPGTTTIPAIQRGEVKLLGWAGAETPYQLVAAFVSTKTANERGTMIRHFLNAYRNAARDYHDALSDGAEQRRDGRNAGEIVDILARYTGISAEQVKLGIPWVDGEQRVDVKDVLRQIAWYQSQGMVKGTINGDEFIDKRYVVPLPER